MAPKRINRKCKNFKSGSNGLAMVDYPIYDQIYDNGHSLARMKLKTVCLMAFLGTYIAVYLVGHGREN